MFFKLAVVGPIVTRGLGVAQQCLTCYHARGRYPNEPSCGGFGAGCLGYRPVTFGGASDTADDRTRPKS